MAYQQDYILRMIEMIGDLVMGILGMIKRGQIEQASEAIEGAYHDFLKEDAAFFSEMALEDMTNKLLEEHHFTNGHLEVLSLLFYAEAELKYARGNSQESVPYYRKTYMLLDFVNRQSRTFSLEKQNRLRLLRERLAELGAE